jgi:hypothetical protein
LQSIEGVNTIAPHTETDRSNLWQTNVLRTGPRVPELLRFYERSVDHHPVARRSPPKIFAFVPLATPHQRFFLHLQIGEELFDR